MILQATVLAAILVSAAPGADSDLAGSQFTAQCLGVYSGDTLLVMRDGKPVMVRLHGVSCPPVSEELGLEAARQTFRLAADRELSVTVVRKGRNGRLAAVVSAEGRDLAVELVRAGLAAHRWAERPHAPLAEAQSLAQGEDLGIWSPSRGLVEVEVERSPPPAREPPPQTLAEISGGELMDQTVVQEDIVWIWSAPRRPIDQEGPGRTVVD